jgi:hypothetical protein
MKIYFIDTKSSCVTKGVNESCRQTLERVLRVKTRKTVHNNMWPETFSLWFLAQTILYMHDGARAYFSRAVRHVPYHISYNRWIDRRRTHCVVSKLAKFESLGLVTVGIPKSPCEYSSCWQWEGSSSLHRGCLSDYQQLPRHLRSDVALHDEPHRSVHWIS